MHVAEVDAVNEDVVVDEVVSIVVTEGVVLGVVLDVVLGVVVEIILEVVGSDLERLRRLALESAHVNLRLVDVDLGHTASRADGWPRVVLPRARTRG